MASLDDLYARLGLAPLLVQPPTAPAQPLVGAQPYVPFDTSATLGTAFGTPYPGGFPTPVADVSAAAEAAGMGSAPATWGDLRSWRRDGAAGGAGDSRVAPTGRVGASASSEAAGSLLRAGLYGYAPQPRPDLPRPLMKGREADVFAGYRDVYDPAQEPVDAVGQLLATLGQAQGQAPVSRALSPQWVARPAQPAPRYGAGQQGLEGQAIEQAGPTPGERALLRRSPAYARAIARIRSLDRVRAGQGL